MRVQAFFHTGERLSLSPSTPSHTRDNSSNVSFFSSLSFDSFRMHSHGPFARSASLPLLTSESSNLPKKNPSPPAAPVSHAQTPVFAPSPSTSSRPPHSLHVAKPPSRTSRARPTSSSRTITVYPPHYSYARGRGNLGIDLLGVLVDSEGDEGGTT